MATASTLRLTVSFLALVLGAPCAALAQTPCVDTPLGFRKDIRLPDAWEMAWESTWPDAREAMAFWRADNFMEVQKLWLRASPCAAAWRTSQVANGLPASAQWLPAVLFDTPACGEVPCGCPQVPDDFWSTLGAADSPEAIMNLALALGPSDLSAEKVRTGMRLLENLELPVVHIVQNGETVYSIARHYSVHPTCLGARNGVWDNLQAGMRLRIPFP